VTEKLWLCRADVSVTFYVRSPTPPSEIDTVGYAEQELGNCSMNTFDQISAVEVTDPEHRLCRNWDRTCLVWGPEGDISLGECLDELKK
jgi:hypothetical protein